jgi:hypothetical protein
VVCEYGQASGLGCGVRRASCARSHSADSVACDVGAGGGTMASDANEMLCVAADRGDVAEIERLVAAGADPNAFEGLSDFSPMQKAARTGHVAAIAALLTAGAHVDGADREGWTPLLYAAASAHTAAIDALLAAGADVHGADKNGDSALHWASFYGRLDAARVLLEAGARTDVRNKAGEQPIVMVCAPLACCGCTITPRGRAIALPLRRCAPVGASPSPLHHPSTPCSSPLPPGPAAGPWH